MNQKELNDKLNELKTEDYIWLLYILIIFASWYANFLERKYFINDDKESKDRYQNLTILIFSVLVIVYLYFLKSSVDDIKKLKENDSEKKKRLTYLSFLGSLLIAISGFIYLYIAMVDNNIDIELAFN